MKPHFRRNIALLLTLAILCTTTGLASAGPAPQLALPMTQADDFSDTTLDLCMYSEPASLYLYSPSKTIWQSQILSAVYDGPMDTRSYDYQPVIFDAVPSFENGMVITQTVSVMQDDWIVDSTGAVVTMTVGTSYLPGGCYDASCAVEYIAGNVEMEQLQVTNRLLDDLLWSDGEPLTAADLEYSFDLNAAVDTPGSKYQVDRTASYTAISGTEAQWVGLPGYFPFNYASIYWSPLPEHLWSSYTAAELVTAELSSRTPLGWGSYEITEWVAGSHIAMAKNPNYFRAAEGLPHFENLVVHFGTESDGMLAGVCDVVVTSYDDLETLLAYDDAGYLEVVATPTTSWEHLDFGIQSAADYTGFAGLTAAFQDLRVRQAFAHCINRQAIADTLFFGFGVVPNTFISDDHPYFYTGPGGLVQVYPHDPLLGQELLEEAGWIDSNADGTRDKDGVEFSITLTTTTASIRYTSASLIAADMATCGVQVAPVHISSGTFFTPWPDGPVFGRQFDLAQFSWITGVKPPCELYLSENIPSDLYPAGQNDPGYTSLEYDHACHTALGSLTELDRQANYGEANQLFAAELPVLPLFFRINYGIAAPHIIGFSLDPTDYTFWNVEEISIGVSEEISEDQSRLLSTADNTTYFFSLDSFSEPVTVTHTPLSPVDVPDLGALAGIGHYFTVEATLDSLPVQPEAGYNLEIRYTDNELGSIVEATLGLYYWDGEAWVLEPSAVVGSDINAILAFPDHFSYWAVLGEPPTTFTLLPIIRK